MKTYDSLIRVSKMNGRMESAESTMTIDDQRASIGSAIRSAGGRIGREFPALDQSGFTIHRSDAYRTILERVRSGESNGLVVAYGDRLTRNWRAVGSFYDDLEEAGADVIIAGMPGVDYRTPEGRTMTGLMAVMSDAQYQAAKARSDRIADATVARGVPNKVAYGYRRNGTYVDGELASKIDPDRDGKALVPDEQTAPTVRLIFELRGDGYSWASICQRLNDAGVPSPTGRQWVHGTLTSIVGNETYIGVVTLGKRRVENAHEPLVTRAQWKAAQSTRTISRNGLNVQGIAGGLLLCSGCGKSLSVISSSADNRRVYGCRRVSSSGRCPRPVYVVKPRADAFVEAAILEVLERGSLRIVASSRDVERARRARDDARAELEAYVVNASALDAALFAKGLQTRQEKVDETSAAYDDLASRAEAAESLPAASGWPSLDLEHRRRVARLLIDSIDVAPPLSRSKLARVEDRFTIRWNSGGDDHRALR